MTKFDQAMTRLRITKDLNEITRMFDDLRAEALARAGNPSMPGGDAMVMLGPGADIEAWGYVQVSAVMGRLTLASTKHLRELELDDIVGYEIEPPLSFLASWVDIVRRDRGQEPSDRRASIAGEARALRDALDWMTAVDDEGAPWWLPVEDFVRQLSIVRLKLEAVLHDGVRHDRIAAECYSCDAAPRLVVHRGSSERFDFWFCPTCNHVYDIDGVRRCFRQMLVRRGEGPEWLSVRAAAAALGRSPDTIRRWIRTSRVASRLSALDKIEVSWADTRDADTQAKRRGKYRASQLTS